MKKIYIRKTVDCFGCGKHLSEEQVQWCPCGNPFCDNCVDDCPDWDYDDEEDEEIEQVLQ